MLPTEQVFRRNSGFTLIELILTISMTSLLICIFFTMLNYSGSVAALGEIEDNTLLNGRYGIEYIKEEIQKADKIISSDKIRDMNTVYPYNIGFMIMNIRKSNDSSNEYTFITYYLNEGKIIRIAQTKLNEIYPSIRNLKGYNEVCDSVLSIENTCIDFPNKMANLSLIVGDNGKEIMEFKCSLYLRCSVDY